MQRLPEVTCNYKIGNAMQAFVTNCVYSRKTRILFTSTIVPPEHVGFPLPALPELFSVAFVHCTQRLNVFGQLEVQEHWQNCPGDAISSPCEMLFVSPDWCTYHAELWFCKHFETNIATYVLYTYSISID